MSWKKWRFIRRDGLAGDGIIGVDCTFLILKVQSVAENCWEIASKFENDFLVTLVTLVFDIG